MIDDILESLMNAAKMDSEVLYVNRTKHGDRPEVWRDLEFVFYAKSQIQAETVAEFVTEFRYGSPSIEEVSLEGEAPLWRLIVVVKAPATDEIVHSISGFMVCVSIAFSLEYDGWGCIVQKGMTPPPLPKM